MVKDGDCFGMDAARDLLTVWSMDLNIDNHVDQICSTHNESTEQIPGSPPIVIPNRSAVEESPISRFRRDALAKDGRHDEGPPLLPQGSGDERMLLTIRPSMSLDEGNSGGDVEGEGTLKVYQARAAISAVSDPSSSRLSDARIQQILVAAMRLEKDNGPSVPHQPFPRTPDSGASSRSARMPSFNSFSLGSAPPAMPIFDLPEESEHDDDSTTVARGEEEDSQGVAAPSQEAGLTTNENEGSYQPRALNVVNQYDDTIENDEDLGGAARQENHTATRNAETGIQENEDDESSGVLIQGKIKEVIVDDGIELKPSFNDNVGIASDGVAKLEPPPRIKKTLFDDTTIPKSQNQNITIVNEPQFMDQVVGGYELELPEPTHGDEEPIQDDIAEAILDNSPFRKRVDLDQEPGNSDKVASNIPTELRLMRSTSMTESDVGSIDGLPFDIQSTLLDSDGRDEILQRLDGIDTMKDVAQSTGQPDQTNAGQDANPSIFDSFGLSFLWGASKSSDKGRGTAEEKSEKASSSPAAAEDQYWDEAIDVLGHCSAIVSQKNQAKNNTRPTLGRSSGSPSNIATIHSNDTASRLHSWINTHYEVHELPPLDGTYELGKSRTVIVHEIKRGDWTWCTAWSPRGDRLALATENHELAVVETTSSTVWRVRHDKRLRGPAVGNTTHSIRSISWGKNFIATGGTGNAVSIISPTEPYPIVHLIKDTGFVGSLCWRADSNILAIGSRSNKLMIVQIRSSDHGKQVESETIFQIEFENWVNRVAFNPDGGLLAVGNASGLLTVYSIEKTSSGTYQVAEATSVLLDDAILAIDWSPDGEWLYAGGEDFHLTVIETKTWKTVKKEDRSRWVQCIASSASGTHVAVGGISSEVSLLDTKNNWESVMGIELKGLVPLSASWHPSDLAFALTGQNDSVLVVETSNSRHMKGHHLHSVSSILSINFSPDGNTAVIGNEAGIVTFFSVSRNTFEIAYELVVVLNDRLSIDWSPNGHFSIIGSKDALIVVAPSVMAPRTGKLRNSAGFSIQRVVRDIGQTNCVSIDQSSRYIAVAGDRIRVFDATKDFRQVRSWRTGTINATAWSPDGSWLATMGENKILYIYNTRSEIEDRWRKMFSLECDFVGHALAWGPTMVGGLLYLAYSGSNTIWIMEIRTLEETWEAVLRIPRDGNVRDLDWNANGLLAAGIDDGTVSIIDLAYLQSGTACNEKDYDWQRQALTCFSEIRRNRGRNCVQTVKWVPSTPGYENLLALGGTDGEVEIVNLTESRRSRDYKTRRGDNLDKNPSKNPRPG